MEIPAEILEKNGKSWQARVSHKGIESISKEVGE